MGQPLYAALDKAREEGLVVDIDPGPPYLERLGDLADLRAIRDAGLSVLVDAMYGAGGGYIPALLSGGTTT